MFSVSNLALQKKISLLVLAGLVLALGVFSFLGIQSLNENTQRILSQRLAMARIVANNIDENMTHAMAHLQGAARLNYIPTDREFVSLVSPLRQTLSATGISVNSIFLIDSNGKVDQVDGNDTDILGADWSQLAEVQKTLQAGKPLLSNQLTEPRTGKQMVLAVVPFVNSKGEILGLLAASIDPRESSINTVTQMVQAGSTGYVEIVDGNGLVLSRTNPGVPPKLLEKSDHPGHFSDLIREDKAVVGTCHRCHEVNQEIKRRRDVLAFAPLSTAPWGVAIRQSEDEALAPTRQLESRLLLVGAIVLIGALLLVWFMTQSVVKPLKTLKAAAGKVATGDFGAAVPLKRKDEIGELSNSFYTMTQELAKSRNQLVSRNKELSALNSVSLAVSQSLDLRQLSETALRNVLEVTQTASGCIFLPDPDTGKLEPVASCGPEGIYGCEKTGLSRPDCACHHVLRHGQSVMVTDGSQCPMLAAGVSGETVTSFASIPLKSRDRALGIMNIACSADRYFTETDFALFDSIGFQVGLAIENSMLYSEAKQKEEQRGQLLSGIISAQEDERKRISRELHDGSGQNLTAAIMKVESLESLVPENDAVLKEKLQGVKALMSHTLEDLRRLTHDLRPMALDDLGLASAIRAYAKNRLEAANIKVEFESKGLNAGGRLTPAIETAVFRIIQEATNNIIKHSEARRVGIHLSVESDMIKAIVEDDGNGFDTDSVFAPELRRQPLGLLGIKERVELLGGAFSIRSRRGQGTRLTVSIPVAYLAASQEPRQDKPEPKKAGLSTQN